MASLKISFNLYLLLFCITYVVVTILVLVIAKKLVMRKISDPPKRLGKCNSYLFVFFSVFLLIFGVWLQNNLREKEHREYFHMASNMGMIFARELRNHGHATIHQSNKEMSMEYTQIYKKMTSWQNHIKEIQSVYTLRMNTNGKLYFVVAPATDYNRDGWIRGEIEKRVPLGTIYDEEIPELEQAFNGRFSMQKEPTTDYWGYSISAFVPVFNGKGEVESVLGIDFDGDQYIQRKWNETWKAVSLIGLVYIVGGLIYLLSLLSAAEKILTKKHQEEVNKLAYFDEFTGLPNRYYLTRLHPLKEWNKEKVAIVLLGFDGLDAINELLGFSKCDNVYMASIRRVEASLQHHMKLIRWSEREHLVIVKNYETEQEVVNYVEALIANFSTPIHIGSKDFYISPKFGVSFYPNDGNDWTTLVKKADLAKSYIRTENDKRVMVYNIKLLAEAHEKRDIELELHNAILKEQFELYYQPQFSLLTGKIMGMEALIRWNHPTKGMVSPLKFIHLAEELHLINQIGLWVLKKACKQSMDLNKVLGLHLRVSVNLSSVQLQHPNLLQHIKDILQETGMDPTLLDLEITEGSLFNFEKSSQVLEDIKDLGVHISLDDFGAGYSSLSYLKKLNIHRLKIDRIFLTNIPNEKDALMTSIVTLGHNLNLKVLAEGAETEAQVKFLKSIQCDEVQGYFFAKPLPYHEFVEYIRKHTGEYAIFK